MSLLKKALISFMKAPPSRLNYLPNVRRPNTITTGSRASTYEFRGRGDRGTQTEGNVGILLIVPQLQTAREALLCSFLVPRVVFTAQTSFLEAFLDPKGFIPYLPGAVS